MATATAGNFALNMDALDVGLLSVGSFKTLSPTQFTVDLGGETITFSGTGFAYDTTGHPIAGLVTGMTDIYLGQLVYNLSGLAVSATSLMQWASTGDNVSARLALMAGSDQITGTALNDVLRGYGGDDLIDGGGGDDTLDGGAGSDTLNGEAGNDLIVVVTGSNVLRGGDGDDRVTGGDGFDDINGNVGADTAHGGAGDDWVVGGKDDDLLFGEDGGDIVYGNLGNDTCDGGAGRDIVRGGQGDDVINGGVGDDWLSGDRGNDTVTGGSGADIFHTFSGAGIDKVMDFNAAEGDRVQLDLGTNFSVHQAGADTVIDLGNGEQMVLVGVQSSTLPANWIFTL